MASGNKSKINSSIIYQLINIIIAAGSGAMHYA
jgi:hypothetical protein